jgi:uncharacterized protein YaaW (UPF0174 family)
MNDYVKSLIRHGLSAGGGYLVAKGLVSADQLPEVVGAVITLASLVWSIWSKKKAVEVKPAE